MRGIQNYATQQPNNLTTKYQTAGHAATAGGLRGHSMGELYPVMIVGRANGYAVENALNGWRSSSVFPTAARAERFAQSIKRLLDSQPDALRYGLAFNDLDASFYEQGA